METFPRDWSFVRAIHQSPVNSPHKGQWRGSLMFSFICAWINGWVNNREASDLRRHRSHYDFTVMALNIQIVFLPVYFFVSSLVSYLVAPLCFNFLLSLSLLFWYLTWGIWKNSSSQCDIYFPEKRLFACCLPIFVILWLIKSFRTNRW